MSTPPGTGFLPDGRFTLGKGKARLTQALPTGKVVFFTLCILQYIVIQGSTNDSRTSASRFWIAHGKGLDPKILLNDVSSKYLTPFTPIMVPGFI